MAHEDLRRALIEAGAARADLLDYASRGVHVEARVPAERVREAAQVLRDRGFLIEDVIGVDGAPEMMVVYHFHLLQGGCRVRLRVLADRESPRVPTIQDIFPGANWHEREQHDFYGVEFEGHPDLSPLILPEDAGDLRPLRKEGKRLKALDEVIPEPAPRADDAGEDA